EVLRAPDGAPDGPPDDLVARGGGEDGALGAVAAGAPDESGVGRPAALGAEVGDAAGAPEAVVERRHPEGAARARLQAHRLRGERLRVEAELRAEGEAPLAALGRVAV